MFTKVCGQLVCLPNPKNNGEVFNYVANWLLKQNIRCAAHPNVIGSSCYYRNEARTRACAAGCLIPDDDYNEHMEGYSINKNGHYDASKYFLDKGYSLQLLIRLQDVHDAYRVDTWSDQLSKVKEDFNLC